jgi:hypothetical protein
MRNLIILLLAAYSINSSFAKQDFSAGFGYDYGGVLGAKYSIRDQDNHYFASLGVIGAAVGYQKITDEEEKHLFGLFAGVEELTSEDGFIGLNYNYYANGFDNEGWVVGLSLGIRRTDGDPLDIGGIFGTEQRETESKALVGLSLGYSF